MKTLQLSRGLFAVVDDEDYQELSKHKWSALKGTNSFYAVRRITLDNGKQRLLLMHREILRSAAPYPVTEIDHIDRNGLNNTRANLRVCTRSQNQANRRKKKKASSKYLGVIYDFARKQWRAEIIKNRKRRYLGRFKTEQEAAIAYNEAAVILHGEYAHLNIITSTTKEMGA